MRCCCGRFFTWTHGGSTSPPVSSPTTSSLLPRAWLAPCSCLVLDTPTAYGLCHLLRMACHHHPLATRPTRTSAHPRAFCPGPLAPDLLHAPHRPEAHCALTVSHYHGFGRTALDTPIKVCKDVDVSLCCLHGEPRHFGCCGLAHSTEVGSSRGDESLCSVRLGSARCRLVPARNDTVAARHFLGRALRVVCMDRIRLVVHGVVTFAQIAPRQ